MTANIDTGRAGRLGGLRRFAIAITILNVIGRAFLGFEQSWGQLLIAIATAYTMEIGLELVLAWSQRRAPQFLGGLGNLVDFLLSAHIAACAVSMLLYGNDRLLPFMFATATAIGSKSIFRVTVGRGSRHFFNPSNFGITVTLLAFPWVGIAPPYHFTENLSGWGDWALPAIIILSGSFLNARFTKRLPLISAWLLTFLAQSLIRSVVFDLAILPGLAPMTGMAFILFTFYMVTDPATTPQSLRGQILFGAGVAIAYSMLLMLHIVFGVFFALTIVCAIRGVSLYVQNQIARSAAAQGAAQRLAVAGRQDP